jgi:hypothetical protein
MPGLADDYTIAPHPASRSHRSQSRNHSRSHHSTRHTSPDRESMMSHNTIRTIDSRKSHASKLIFLNDFYKYCVENQQAEDRNRVTTLQKQRHGRAEATKRFQQS